MDFLLSLIRFAACLVVQIVSRFSRCCTRRGIQFNTEVTFVCLSESIIKKNFIAGISVPLLYKSIFMSLSVSKGIMSFLQFSLGKCILHFFLEFIFHRHSPFTAFSCSMTYIYIFSNNTMQSKSMSQWGNLCERGERLQLCLSQWVLRQEL